MENKDYDESWEVYQKWNEIYKKKREEIDKNNSMKVRPMTKEEFYGDCDHPNTMENSTATIFYIIIMVVGAIFYDRWLIWVAATIIYLSHIFRHEIRKINKK